MASSKWEHCALLRPVYGHHKQGASFGHAKVAGRALLRKGLSPLITTLSTPTAAPVIAEAWLRGGKTGSGRGAARQLKQAATTAKLPPKVSEDVHVDVVQVDGVDGLGLQRDCESVGVVGHCCAPFGLVMECAGQRWLKGDRPGGGVKRRRRNAGSGFDAPRARHRSAWGERE